MPLFEGLPPEFQGMAEEARVSLRALLQEHYIHGLTDMAVSMTVALEAVGLHQLAELPRQMLHSGVSEVARINAERKGR